MKRLIRPIYASSDVDIDTSMFDGTPFKPDTDTSYYNNFLNEKDLAYMQKAKNRTGDVVLMSPNEYFEACSKYGFPDEVSVDNLHKSRKVDTETNDWMKQMMLSGEKFELPYINYADRTQEGLHRMMAAGNLFGWDTKFPVLIVKVFDTEWDNQIKAQRAFNDFNEYTFPKICKHAANNISDWRNPPPDNFVDQLKAEIIKSAQLFGEDTIIDVDIEINEREGHPLVQIWLSDYGAYTPTNLTDPVDIWLEDLYDLSGGTTSSDKIQPKDIADLSDDDIVDLFFM